MIERKLINMVYARGFPPSIAIMKRTIQWFLAQGLFDRYHAESLRRRFLRATTRRTF